MWKRLLLGLAIAALILFLLFRKVDPAAVWAALRGGNWALLAVGLGCSFTRLWLKGERWALALAAGTGAPRPRKRMFSAMIIGTAGNLLLPARLGDFAKVVVLRRHNDLPMTRSLSASWSVQIFDFLAVALILLLSGTAVASPRVLAGVLVGGLLLLVGMYFSIRHPDCSERLERALIPARFLPKVQATLRNARQGLHFLGHGRTLGSVLAMTAACWLCDSLGMVASLRAFHLEFGLRHAALLVAAIGLSFALPLTPGNVGVYQAICVLVLGSLGVARDRAFAFGLGVQAFGLVGIVLLGLALLQREGLRLKALAAEKAAGEGPTAAGA
jgi:uncharacterized protein (TIRG00374 family)